ncbi:MAG: Uncharacterized protein XE05_0695 [Thermotogales bacterium 46_20]|nr:MAG: Uncharacterized protein XE05_0695 [Thermotogales bacterium 46_20]
MNGQHTLNSQTYSDPVRNLMCKYPRILVIRAAFKLLRDGKNLGQDEMEKLLRVLLEK